MDNQRILLYAALGFIALILWQNWQIQYGPKPAIQQQPVNNAPSASEASTAADLPVANLQSGSSDSAAGAPTAEIASTGAKISVQTDVLQAEVDSRGGTISSVKLIKYPVSIDQPDEPFTLMSDEPAHYFVAQTGLQSAVTGGAPTHLNDFSYESSNYVLEEGKSELRIPLHWTSPSGVKITKTLVFQRDSYLIRIEYTIENDSAEAYVVNQYRQLQRKPVTDNETQSFIYNYIGGVISTPENPYSKIDFDDMDDSDLNQPVVGGWEAVLQHYFVGALLPQEGENNTFYTKALSSPKRYILGMYSEAKTIAPGQSGDFVSELYIGPKDQDRLSEAAEKLNLVVGFRLVDNYCQSDFLVT